MGNTLLVILITLPAGLLLGWTVRWLYARYQLSSSEQKAERVKQEAIKEAENKRKEMLLEAKDQLIRDRNNQERDLRDRRAELQKFEKRLQQKEDNLEKKLQGVDQQVLAFEAKEQEISNRETGLTEQEGFLKTEIERISGLTAEEAKRMIIQKMENDAKHDAQVIINKIEQEATTSAEKKARDILVTTLQRVATEVTSEVTVTSVSLPNEEMKGRIIGREGRNIRTLETLTGVDVIIDDTPEAVVISCFDPIRKTIAKTSLERLIQDGRIHPARIEEVVNKVAKEINQTIYEEGERVCFDMGIHNLSQELVKALGRLHYPRPPGRLLLAGQYRRTGASGPPLPPAGRGAPGAAGRPAGAASPGRRGGRPPAPPDGRHRVGRIPGPHRARVDSPRLGPQQGQQGQGGPPVGSHPPAALPPHGAAWTGNLTVPPEKKRFTQRRKGRRRDEG